MDLTGPPCEGSSLCAIKPATGHEFPVVQWLSFRVFTAAARVQNLIEDLCLTLSWHNQKKPSKGATRTLQGPASQQACHPASPTSVWHKPPHKVGPFYSCPNMLSL